MTGLRTPSPSRPKALEATAPFYEGTLIGQHIIVPYNSDHPAYQRLTLDNRDNCGQITGMTSSSG